MINRATTITVDYCPQMDGKADLDKDCDGCEYYEGLNADYEVLCGFEKQDTMKELLPEIESLKRQLQEAAIFAASQPHCPDGKDCDGYSTSEQSCTACWLEYWQSGTFQNGNNHKEASK